jgi:pentalenene oxygenase
VIRSAPGALPLLGHAIQLRRDPLRFLTSLPAHGDVVRIRLGPWPSYVVCRPDLVQRVLSADRTFDKGGPFIDAFRTIVGNGLGTCPHRQHRRRRRLLRPAFHQDRLATCVSTGHDVPMLIRSRPCPSTADGSRHATSS